MCAFFKKNKQMKKKNKTLHSGFEGKKEYTALSNICEYVVDPHWMQAASIYT